MQPPVLPIGARIMNGLGGAVRGIGVPLLPLDPEGCLERARSETGLSDFGDDAFREGLERLLESAEREASLTTIGRMMVRQEVQRCLSNRLQLVDWRKRNPEIAEQRIDRPIIIMGQGRTGTTILHELLALDPRNRVPMTWEVELPCPPPERASFETDPRIAQTQQTLDSSERLIPDFKKIHRMGAQLPQECVRFMGYELASIIFSTTWRIPSYTRWALDEADMSKVYTAHRQFLQHLQWRCPAERWVLKTPAHLWYLPQLMAEYPDACLIQTHRDPLKILSSMTSLHVVLRKMASNDIDVTGIAREWSEWLTLGYDRSVDFRTSGALRDDQVIDLQFHRFVRDPLGAIERIYEHFDLELEPAVADRMRAYVEGNPDDRDGRHSHQFSETGLDPDEEREKVRRYQETFDVPSEKIT